MALPPLTRLRWRNACRLVPSRFPSAGILDRVAAPKDLPFIFELETWTNDRISAELSILHRVPEEEWVTGPQASVIMAAYCHPRPDGGRFNEPDRGAWYAARRLETAQAEIAYHRGRELAEIGVTEARMEMRLYVADFNADFHDVRALNGAIHDPASYRASQALARELMDCGSNGVVYRSVRHEGGECIACFRPKLVAHVRPGAHFEFSWQGRGTPRIRHLSRSPSA
jgi:hypothetical protein